MEAATSSSAKSMASHFGRALTAYNVKRHNFTKNRQLGSIMHRKKKASPPTKILPSSSSKTPSSPKSEEMSNHLFSTSEFYNAKNEDSPKKKYYTFVLLSNQVVEKKQSKMYACDVCGASYRHVFSLKRHFLRNHVTVKYISKADISNCKIIIHEDPNSASLVNDSDESSLSSRSSESKKRHRSSDLATLNDGLEGLYRCHLCSDVKFNTKLELKAHYSMHPSTSKVRFPCNKCGAVFSHKQTLLRHHLTHATTAPSFQCKTCGKRFDNKPSYLKHLHAHTDNRRCKYCSKILSTSANKRRHERIHEGLKPYPCKRCDAQFSQSGDLKKHLKQEHQVSYFSCRLCRAVFSSKIALTKHADEQHPSDLPRKSPNIELPPPPPVNHVPPPKAIKEKRESTPTKSFSCTVCKKICPTYISMLRHRRQTHPFLHTRKVHRKIKFSHPTRILPKRNVPQKTEAEFYLSISSTIADNLLNHVDGKTSQLSLRQYNFSDQLEHCTPIPTHPWSCYNFPSDFDVDVALRNRGHEIKNRPCESIIPFTDAFAPNGYESFSCDSNGAYDFTNHCNSNSELSDSEDFSIICGLHVPSIDIEERKKMIGRKVQSILMCCACKEKFLSRETFNNHCENNHPNVLCTYIEIEGDSNSPPVVPEDLTRQFLSPVGIYFSCNVPPPISEVSSISCTKCKSVFPSAPELHQHIVHCGGIETPIKHVRRLFTERKIKRTMKSRMNTSLIPRFAQNRISKPEVPQVPKVVSSNLDMHSKMYKNLMDFRPKPSVGRPRLNLCINCPHCTQTFRTKTLLNAHIGSCYRRKFHKRKSSKALHVLNKKIVSASSNFKESSNQAKLQIINKETEPNGTVPAGVTEKSETPHTKSIPLQSNAKSQKSNGSISLQPIPLPKSVKLKSKETTVNDKPTVRESLTMHIALLPTPTIKHMSSKETPSLPTPAAKELSLKPLKPKSPKETLSLPTLAAKELSLKPLKPKSPKETPSLPSLAAKELSLKPLKPKSPKETPSLSTPAAKELSLKLLKPLSPKETPSLSTPAAKELSLKPLKPKSPKETPSLSTPAAKELSLKPLKPMSPKETPSLSTPAAKELSLKPLKPKSPKETPSPLTPAPKELSLKPLKPKSPKETPSPPTPAAKELSLKPLKPKSPKETPSVPTLAAKELSLKPLKPKSPKEPLVNAIPVVTQPVVAQVAPFQKLAIKNKLPKEIALKSPQGSRKSLSNDVSANLQAKSPQKLPSNLKKGSTKPTGALRKSPVGHKSPKKGLRFAQDINGSSVNKEKPPPKLKSPRKAALTPLPFDLTSKTPNAVSKMDSISKVPSSTTRRSLPADVSSLPDTPVPLDSVLTGKKLNLVPVVKKRTVSNSTSPNASSPALSGTKGNVLNQLVNGKDTLSNEMTANKTNLLSLTSPSMMQMGKSSKSITKDHTSTNTTSALPKIPAPRLEETTFVPITISKELMSNIIPSLTMHNNDESIDHRVDSPRERLSPSFEILINSINEKLHSDELSPSHPTFSWMEDEHIIIPSKPFLSATSFQSESAVNEDFSQRNSALSSDTEQVKEVVNDLVNLVEYSIMPDLSPLDKEPHSRSSIDSILQDFEFKFKEIGIPVSKEILSQVSSAISPTVSSLEEAPSKKPLSLRSFRRRKALEPNTTLDNDSAKESTSSSSAMLPDTEKPEQSESHRCPYCLLDFKYFLNFRRHANMCRQKRSRKARMEPPPKSPCVLHLPKKDEVEESMLNLLRHQSRQSQIMKEAKPDDNDEGKRLHTYTCDICHKIFLSLFKLLQHRVVHKLQNADDQGVNGSSCSEQSSQSLCTKLDQTPNDNPEESQDNSEKQTCKTGEGSSDVAALLQSMLQQIESISNAVNEGSFESLHDDKIATPTVADSTSDQSAIDLSTRKRKTEAYQKNPKKRIAVSRTSKAVAEIIDLEIKENKSESNQNNQERSGKITGIKNSNLSTNVEDMKMHEDTLNIVSTKHVESEDGNNSNREHQESPVLEAMTTSSLKPIKPKIKRKNFPNTKPATKARKKSWGRKNWVVRKSHVTATKRKLQLKTTSVTEEESPAEPAESLIEPTEPPVEPAEPPIELTEPPVEPAEPAIEPAEPIIEPTEPLIESTEPPIVATEPPIVATNNVISAKAKPSNAKRKFSKLAPPNPIQKRKRKKMVKRNLNTVVRRGKLTRSNVAEAKRTINSHMKIKKKYKRTIAHTRAMKKNKDVEIIGVVMNTPDVLPIEEPIVHEVVDLEPSKPLKRKYRRGRFPRKKLVPSTANEKKNSEPVSLVTERSTDSNVSTAEPSTDKPIVKNKRKRRKVKKIVFRKRQGLKPGPVPKKTAVEIPNETAPVIDVTPEVTEAKPKGKRSRKNFRKPIKSQRPVAKSTSSVSNTPNKSEKTEETKPVIKSVKRFRKSRMTSIGVAVVKKDSLPQSSPTDIALPISIKIEEELEVDNVEDKAKPIPLSLPHLPKKRGWYQRPSKRCPFCQKVFSTLNFMQRHIGIKHKGQCLNPKVKKIDAKAKLFKKKRRAFKRQCKTEPVPQKMRDTKIALQKKKKK